MSSPAPDQLFRFGDAVARRAAGTPYTVTPTASGFDVGIVVADARWWEVFHRVGLRKTFVHHVTVDGGGRYSVTDDGYDVEWDVGGPRLSASRSTERFVGRKMELSSRKVYAFDDGRFGTVVDYTFNSEEGRGLITAAAQEVGLTPRQPLVAAAALALAVAVLVLITVALGWMFLA